MVAVVVVVDSLEVVEGRKEGMVWQNKEGVGSLARLKRRERKGRREREKKKVGLIYLKAQKGSQGRKEGKCLEDVQQQDSEESRGKMDY